MPDSTSNETVIREWEEDIAAGCLMPRLQSLRSEPRALTAEQVCQFDADGVLFPLPGCSAEEAAALRQKIESLEAKRRQGGNGLFSNGHVLYKWFYEMATRDELLNVVEDLIGPNIMIWKSALWIKEPNSGSYVGWHQDARYWGLAPLEAVNVWLAVSDVRPESGPLEFLRSSHQKVYTAEETYLAHNLLTRGQTINWTPEAGPDPAQVVPAVLRPGQFSIHHLGTAHGGGANKGSDRRIGFNVTYITPRMRSVRPDGAFAMLVRGVDAYGHFTRDRAPSGDEPTPEELEAFKAKAGGLSRTTLSDADLARFREVAKQRRALNVASHVLRDSSGYAEHLGDAASRL